MRSGNSDSGTPSKVRAGRGLIAAACLALAAPLQAQMILEEVLVVAQKRTQNLQEVPVAVTAFSAKDLELSGTRDVFDLSTLAPGLQVRQGGAATNTNFRIRGIGTAASNFGLESAVGLYVDGVYRSQQASLVNELVDMAGVEVLRGPQGTLFGRNTLAGAVLMNTVAPGHDRRDGFAELTAGNYDLLKFSGASSISAIEDVLAFRAAGFSSQRDGYVDDIRFGDGKHYDRDRWGARLQGLYTPTDSFSLRVIADYSELDEICCALMVTQDNLRPVALPPGAVPYAGTDELVRALGGTVLTGDRFYDHVIAQSLLTISETEDSGLSATVEWDLGAFKLTSITGYRSFDLYVIGDGDAGDLDSLTSDSAADKSAWTQELRISGDVSRLNYVAGLYYFSQDLDSDSVLELGEQINGIFSHTLVYYADTGGQFPLEDIPSFPLPLVPLFVPGSGVRNAMEQDHEAYAVFGQVEYELAEALTLTAGLRYTREEKDLSGLFTQGSAPDYTDNVVALPEVLDQVPAFAPQDPVIESLRDDQVTGTVKLTRFFGEDMMAYASYATGYKAGGTNTDRIDPVLDYVFGPETSAAFEVGLKADFPERALRLNVALHRTDIDDLQVNNYGEAGFVLQSVGAVETWGGEVEATWFPTESLTLIGAYAITEGEIEEWENDLCWVAAGFHTGRPDPGDPTNGENTTACDRSGDDLPRSPDQLILTANQAFELSEAVDGFLLVEYSRVGESELSTQDPFLKTPSYDLLNLRLGLRFLEYDTEVTFWGRNVLDENYRYSGSNPVGQPGRVVASPREPATWGLSLRKNF